MTKALRLISIGNSTGLVLPREVLERMRVERGDQLYLVETPRGFEVTPYDPEFAAQLESAERIMREDRDVLAELAK